MPHRVLPTALITANVFQNGLSRRDHCRRLYTELLRRLSTQRIDWYMTALDVDLAFTLWDVYQLGGDEAYYAAYAAMVNQIKTCSVTQSILEEASHHQINFYDAIRLACALDRHLEMIVTWEPNQFAHTMEDHYRILSDGYFHINKPTQALDPQDTEPTEQTITVYSVPAFLLHLGRLDREGHPQAGKGFCLVKIQSIDDDENTQATAILLNPQGQQFQATAQGNTPFDALQQAIDQAVDQFVRIPPRRLSRFFVPASTLQGADAPVEAVIRVECGGLNFEQSASNNNVMRAAAEAYIKVINEICNCLNRLD